MKIYGLHFFFIFPTQQLLEKTDETNFLAICRCSIKNFSSIIWILEMYQSIRLVDSTSSVHYLLRCKLVQINFSGEDRQTENFFFVSNFLGCIARKSRYFVKKLY